MPAGNATAAPATPAQLPRKPSWQLLAKSRATRVLPAGERVFVTLSGHGTVIRLPVWEWTEVGFVPAYDVMRGIEVTDVQNNKRVLGRDHPADASFWLVSLSGEGDALTGAEVRLDPNVGDALPLTRRGDRWAPSAFSHGWSQPTNTPSTVPYLWAERWHGGDAVLFRRKTLQRRSGAEFVIQGGTGAEPVPVRSGELCSWNAKVLPDQSLLNVGVHCRDEYLSVEHWAAGKTKATVTRLPGAGAYFKPPHPLDGANELAIRVRVLSADDMYVATDIVAGDGARRYVAHFDGRAWSDVSPAADANTDVAKGETLRFDAAKDGRLVLSLDDQLWIRESGAPSSNQWRADAPATGSIGWAQTLDDGSFWVSQGGVVYHKAAASNAWRALDGSDGWNAQGVTLTARGAVVHSDEAAYAYHALEHALLLPSDDDVAEAKTCTATWAVYLGRWPLALAPDHDFAEARAHLRSGELVIDKEGDAQLLLVRAADRAGALAIQEHFERYLWAFEWPRLVCRDLNSAKGSDSL